MKIRALASAILLAFGQPALPAGLPDLGDSSESTLSVANERALGIQTMREVRADRSYVNEPELTTYLQNLGMRLAEKSAKPATEFEFFMVRDPTLNAFALPGGFVGVHTGLILAAQTESELAGVLAHEITHVTQRHIARLYESQSNNALISLAALALAILASRSNSQASQAALVTGQAAMVQNQLDFTRAHEEEADRIGVQILATAGFDTRGLATFFGRLQKASRAYESNAPSYLRTHPLTTDRIAEIENRLQAFPGRQVPSSLDFWLVKAKIRAALDSPQEAMRNFEGNSSDGAYPPAARAYGRALVLRRMSEREAAEREVAQLRKSGPQHPMVESLAADLRRDAKDFAGALPIYRAAMQVFPRNAALFNGQVETLLDLKRNEEALRAVNDRLALFGGDERLRELQARTYAALGKRLLQHQSLAELYVLQGNIPAAVDQLQLALRAGDGDFYQTSSAEARLRELRSQLPKPPKGVRAEERPR